MSSRRLLLSIRKPRRPVLTVLLVVAGLLLVTSSLWLFSDDGELEYTYERTEIEVEDGQLSYDHPGRYLSGNDLNSVDCTLSPDSLLCALDRYILESGPITVSSDYGVRTRGPTYTLVGGAYYERVTEETDAEGRYTLDLERVGPEELLSAIATDVSQIDEDDRRFDDIPLEYQVAVTGETTTTTTHLDADSVGEVFVRNDTYYMVVATGHEQIDRPLLPEARGPLFFIGLLFVFASFVQVIDRVDLVE